MVSAYLLTIAITVVTALHYISVIRPFAYEIPVLSVAALLLLGTLHWVGVRELPRVALAMAIAALVCEAALVWAVLSQVQTLHWAVFWTSLKDMAGQRWTETATGFAAAWLAFSGLESLGQLAPALREPRRRVLRIVAVLVVVSLVVTVPMFTVIAVEAAQASGIGPHPALLAAVAEAYGGRALLIAVSLTGAGFLLVGANVAFIGCYNVFKAVGELGYLPAALAARHKRYGTPRVAIIVITVATVLLVITTRGELFRLGKVFAFGLLGSYAITSVSLAVIAWREKRRGLPLIIGVLSSLALLIPWVTSWFTKPVSTLYGVAVTGLQLAIAFVTHRGWIRSGRFGYLRAASAERAAAAGPTANERHHPGRGGRVAEHVPVDDAGGAARAQQEPVPRGGPARARRRRRGGLRHLRRPDPGAVLPAAHGPVGRRAGRAGRRGQGHHRREDGGGPDLAAGPQPGRVDRRGGRGAGRALRVDGDHGAFGGLVIPAWRRAQGAAERAARAGARGDL